MAVMLAVYLAVVRGNKVALVETMDRDCIRQAGVVHSNLDKRKFKFFNKKISIFSQSDMGQISEIVSGDYDYVVLDLGADFDSARQFFLLCNFKMVIGNLVWWKLAHFVSFLAKTESMPKHKWCFLANNVNTKAYAYFKHKFKIKIGAIPYEEDPFFLSEKTLLFMEQLIRTG